MKAQSKSDDKKNDTGVHSNTMVQPNPDLRAVEFKESKQQNLKKDKK